MSGPRPLVVGISVASPAPAELVRLGMGPLHVRYVFVELVRHILAPGWSVAYGGDFRKEGYTEVLLDLVRTYDRRDIPGPDRVFSYLAWPRWVGLPPQAGLANIATLVKVPPPDKAPPSLPPEAERSGFDLLWNSLALTGMRSQMTTHIGARLVLGGRTAGQSGLLPGVVEEAALALGRGVPLYVVGGFGGGANLVAEALRGREPAQLSVEYQAEHTPRYGELLEAARELRREPDFGALVDRFASTGLGGLENGLSEEENQQLAMTDDLDQVVALVLRGLRTLESPDRRPVLPG